MKVMIAMSGGVDSSVAAKLVCDAGYDCIGATMQLCSKKLNSNAIDGDAAQAENVCRRLAIPFEVFNLEDKFDKTVVNSFIRAYELGLTPNPCIECNKHIKFDEFYRLAKERGCEKIATGHYAKVEFNDITNRWELKKGADPQKDQSYVLYTLTQEQLSHTLFPLGELKKSEIREKAEQSGFENAQRKDSQDICFVPDGDYASFIERYRGKKYSEGDFVDIDGNFLGRHKGIINYTIGQRKGLGIALGKPVFVIEKNIENGTVTLSDEQHLFYKKVIVKEVNFISTENLSEKMRVLAKLRYKHIEQPATLFPLGDGRVMLEFDTPQRAPSPGQSAVFYDGDRVVGGGIIEGGVK